MPVDEYDTSFGIRWFRFDAHEGFFLNGEHFDIHGANVHQDHAGWSDAVTRAGMARDIKLMKDCGFQFIRGSHYPHHTWFADECDKQGMLFWSELCYWGTGGPKVEGYWTSSAYPVRDEDKEAFEASCLLALQEMIRTNRNHPSIIVWSMSNEPFFSDLEVMNEARTLIVRLVEESHRLDPSRPAAVGGAQRMGFDALGDLAGYNGDGAALYVDPDSRTLYPSTAASSPTVRVNMRRTTGTEWSTIRAGDQERRCGAEFITEASFPIWAIWGSSIITGFAQCLVQVQVRIAWHRTADSCARRRGSCAEIDDGSYRHPDGWDG
ncbi:glycoside hydrolase family 2 TIM barrel-domain containing protein [Paenibacillus sp. D2_2]|nr:glycoside hydrolase family 2 TIM barrel-domain containing protein [Paenibacillus sp. D2_2]WMT43500.1 glycoside hydrolase family 2 TIM barrel-domain containing protein [Paenibacillus sp. D2_2]